ncbi:AAA family ATPase [Saccharothrix deserti]|uniref:AAA family ATPase n=1 Tax=Saccharothrix deserti TaxID=2593674 RepID=UPI00131C1994|nr:AAA family ATPase [Saccharothrix deserti]
MTAEVEKPVVVAVLGTHSTGKSTFLARLAHELRREQVQVSTVADLGEQAQRVGLPILRNHTWASTLWIITRGISNELEAWLHADVVLVDRAVPDALGYYRAALAHRGEHPDPRVWARLEAIVRDHSTHYDLLYRTTLDPDTPLGESKPATPTPRSGNWPTTTSAASCAISACPTDYCPPTATTRRFTTPSTSPSAGSPEARAPHRDPDDLLHCGRSSFLCLSGHSGRTARRRRPPLARPWADHA